MQTPAPHNGMQGGGGAAALRDKHFYMQLPQWNSVNMVAGGYSYTTDIEYLPPDGTPAQHAPPTVQRILKMGMTVTQTNGCTRMAQLLLSHDDIRIMRDCDLLTKQLEAEKVNAVVRRCARQASGVPKPSGAQAAAVGLAGSGIEKPGRVKRAY